MLTRDVAQRFHRRGALVEGTPDEISEQLREIAAADPIEIRAQFEQRRLDMLASYALTPAEQRSKPYAFSRGMAIIPVHGLLMNRLNWSASYATGYDFIRSQMNAALADPDVGMIVYDVNSP